MASRASVAAALVALALVAAGCLAPSSSSSTLGYPTGPSLEEHGLRERCPNGGGDCTQRATQAITAALPRLGAEIRNTPITTTAGAPPADRLYVMLGSDPPLPWQSSAGAEGTGAGFVVDLTDAEPYIVVAPQSAFRLHPADAQAIRDALFVER